MKSAASPPANIRNGSTLLTGGFNLFVLFKGYNAREFSRRLPEKKDRKVALRGEELLMWREIKAGAEKDHTEYHHLVIGMVVIHWDASRDSIARISRYHCILPQRLKKTNKIIQLHFGTRILNTVYLVYVSSVSDKICIRTTVGTE